MRRALCSALLLSLFACRHESPVVTSEPNLPPAYAQFLSRHHAVMGWVVQGEKRCGLQLIPSDNGQCHTTEALEGEENQARRRDVRCGEMATLCGAEVPCDCSSPVPDEPCATQKVEPVRRTVRPKAYEQMEYEMEPPHQGRCKVHGKTSTGSASMDWFGMVWYGDSPEFDPDVHCRCDDFLVQADGGALPVQ